MDIYYINNTQRIDVSFTHPRKLVMHFTSPSPVSKRHPVMIDSSDPPPQLASFDVQLIRACRVLYDWPSMDRCGESTGILLIIATQGSTSAGNFSQQPMTECFVTDMQVIGPRSYAATKLRLTQKGIECCKSCRCVYLEKQSLKMMIHKLVGSSWLDMYCKRILGPFRLLCLRQLQSRSSIPLGTHIPAYLPTSGNGFSRPPATSDRRYHF